MHVEKLLLFSMNISDRLDGDKAKLNCSSEGMREKIVNPKPHHCFTLQDLRKHYESTSKLWSFNFGDDKLLVPSHSYGEKKNIYDNDII